MWPMTLVSTLDLVVQCRNQSPPPPLAHTIPLLPILLTPFLFSPSCSHHSPPPYFAHTISHLPLLLTTIPYLPILLTPSPYFPSCSHPHPLFLFRGQSNAHHVAQVRDIIRPPTIFITCTPSRSLPVSSAFNLKHCVHCRQTVSRLYHIKSIHVYSTVWSPFGTFYKQTV
jgi:hypothetical protein